MGHEQRTLRDRSGTNGFRSSPSTVGGTGFLDRFDRERLALFALWLLAASFVSITPASLGWFVPLLYLKLLVSHLVGAD